jgi:hypothetical protein
VHRAKGFGVDSEKRLRLSGPDFTRINNKRHAIDRSVQAQIVEFPSVSAPSKALRSLAGYQKTFPDHTQRVVAAVERLM